MSFVLSFILHLNRFDKDLAGHHVWRQSQTQLNIRNFYRHDSNILNPRVAHFNGGKDNVCRYEFPLMQWSIAMVQKVFGEHISVTRICLFFLGILTLLGLYQFLVALGFSPLIASLGVWAFNFSPVFFYYIINPIPDNLALCASMWFFAFFFKYRSNQSLVSLCLAAGIIMLAILAKLPFIVLGLAVFWLFLLGLKQKKINWKLLMLFGLALVPPLLWYKWVIPSWVGNGVLLGVFDNQISFGLAVEIAWFHFIETLPNGLLNPIAVLFFLTGLIVFIKRKIFKTRNFKLLFAAFVGCLLYFFLEINMIHFHHDYYLFPFFPFTALITAYGLKYVFDQKNNWKKYAYALLFLMPFLCLVLTQKYWNIHRSGPNQAIYLHQKELQEAAPKDAKCIIMNDHSMFVFAYKIDKQGFVFSNDDLPSDWFADMIDNHGATYFYSDSRVVDEREEVQFYIDSLVIQRGTVKVFKLKGKGQRK